MNTLRFQCPATGREVDSGISAHRSTRLISIRARCSICKDVHEWRVADRSLVTVVSGRHHSTRAQSAKARNAPYGTSAEVIELREQLLRELNHRLKNNLQTLYGLLELAHRKTENSEARVVLSDLSRRIGAMGTAQRIFDSLRNSSDVSGQRFLEAVCANAKIFFGKEVSIAYEVTTGPLPKETAMPLALVLNELLTNAAKYGANDCGRVTIDVGLSQRSGSHELYVQDCGPGFNFEEAQERSSGLGLVATLTQRLKGTFTVERRSGARCTLTFPDQ